MTTVTYKSLTALQPVELSYNFYKTESFKKDTVSFTEGYNFLNYECLKNFQDIAVNRNTCFLLTDAVSLSTVFQSQEELTIGEIPCTVNLQSQNTTIYYLGYDTERNVVTQLLTPQNIFVAPINEQEVELRIGSIYLQIDETYPYTVRGSELPLTQDQIYRRRFRWVYQNNTICFIASTKEGDRYLAFGPDNVLRAVGVILGTRVLNDYNFKISKVTDTDLNYNFELKNNWFTYYLDFASQKNNTNLEVNKKFDVPINYLFSFPIQNSRVQKINIANLKTGYTPTGSPSPVDNSYDEEIITTN